MSIRAVFISLAALLFILALPGCSTVQVHSDFEPGTDFSAYKSFAQMAPPKTAGKSLPGYSEITGRHIQSSIAHELELKGLTLASKGDADLLVAFSIDGQPRQEVEGGDYYYGGDAYTVDYVEGTLIIDVIDAKTKKLVWHAYGLTELYGGDSGGNAQKVDDAVSEILKKFPPEPKTN